MGCQNTPPISVEGGMQTGGEPTEKSERATILTGAIFLFVSYTATAATPTTKSTTTTTTMRADLTNKSN